MTEETKRKRHSGTDRSGVQRRRPNFGRTGRRPAGRAGNLNQYCVNAALHNPEVIKKPLKVVYKTNEGLKEALVAICLAYSLVNPRRKLRENKEFLTRTLPFTSAPATSSSSISEKLRRTAYRRPFTGTSSKTGSFTSTGNAAELRRWWTKRPIWRGWTTTSAAAIRCTNSPAFTANIRKNEAPGRKKQNFRTGRFPQCRRSVGGNRSDQTAAARRQKPDGNHRLAVKSGCLLPAGNRTQAARAASNRLSESGTPFKRPPAVP